MRSHSVHEKSLLLLSEFQPVVVGSTLALVSVPLTSLYLFWIVARECLFATNVSSFDKASNLKQR